MLGTLRTHVLIKKKGTDVKVWWVTVCDSELLQLVNAWLVELWDECEHKANCKNIMESCCDHSSLMERCPKSDGVIETLGWLMGYLHWGSGVFLKSCTPNSQLCHVQIDVFGIIPFQLCIYYRLNSSFFQPWCSLQKILTDKTAVISQPTPLQPLLNEATKVCKDQTGSDGKVERERGCKKITHTHWMRLSSSPCSFFLIAFWPVTSSKRTTP